MRAGLAGSRAVAPTLAATVRSRSAGQVARVTVSGPVLAGWSRRRRRRLRAGTFAPRLRRSDRLAVACLTAGWAICLVAFWVWWLQPGHRLGAFGLVINSVLLLYVSCFPVFFMVGVNRLRAVAPGLPVPALRVAFVVTRAPSEPWEIARETLSAMIAQRFPFRYQVWLCDERPDPGVLRWCAERGVRVSSRSGVAEYHRDSWPRRTRCKEGNLAYFYDHWGYRCYDVVAQLDCDHVPAPTYLAEIVRPFADPAIGYVAAPSICDANAAGSWSARGRLYREATFHGPVQLGHSDGLAPVCIGSHYAVRTSAVAAIGGIGPELAEDFSTAFLLNAAGWHGAFAIDAEAHGDGPATFRAMGVQEFQWSRSLTTILLGLLPRNIGRLPWRLRVRFCYALSYYVLLTATTLGGLALAPGAAVTGQQWVDVSYPEFLLRWWSISVWVLAITLLLRRRGLLRPPDAPVLSWESWLYCLVRWPVVALGVAVGVARQLRRRRRPLTFAVTPKGAGGAEVLPARLVVPCVVVSLVSSGAALAGERLTGAAGYVFLCVLAGLVYAAAAVAVSALHARESAHAGVSAHAGTAAGAGLSFGAALRSTALAPLALGLAAAVPAMTAAALYPAYATSLFGL